MTSVFEFSIVVDPDGVTAFVLGFGTFTSLSSRSSIACYASGTPSRLASSMKFADYIGGQFVRIHIAECDRSAC